MTIGVRQQAVGNSKNLNLVVCALCAMLFALCSSTEAQQPKKVARIGYVATADPATESNVSEGIRLALRELGYIEGQNIVTEYRYADGNVDRYPEIAAELVRLKVGVIVVAGGDGLTRAVMNATKRIPIVMTGRGADPVEASLVKSLARPGGNVTGITNISRGLDGKRLELLKEAVPKLARVAVLYEPAQPSSVREIKEVLPLAARPLRLTIQPWELRGADDFDKFFAAMSKQRPDGVYARASPLTRANVNRIARFALKSQLPLVYENREAVNAGALMYYGADTVDRYRLVASYVDKILKGANPAELPVEQPTKFELVINLKTAKQIGVTIPQSMLYRADKVIR